MSLSWMVSGFTPTADGSPTVPMMVKSAVPISIVCAVYMGNAFKKNRNKIGNQCHNGVFWQNL
jgi:hypothetical protein